MRSREDFVARGPLASRTQRQGRDISSQLDGSREGVERKNGDQEEGGKKEARKEKSWEEAFKKDHRSGCLAWARLDR
jgi:hypothetical protein